MFKFKGSVTSKKSKIFADIKHLSDNVITFLIIITLQKIILLGVHILITLQRTYNILNQKSGFPPQDEKKY